jgi:hypothetical protein
VPKSNKPKVPIEREKAGAKQMLAIRHPALSRKVSQPD